MADEPRERSEILVQYDEQLAVPGGLREFHDGPKELDGTKQKLVGLHQPLFYLCDDDGQLDNCVRVNHGHIH
jgi:hypothetical protein